MGKLLCCILMIMPGLAQGQAVQVDEHGQMYAQRVFDFPDKSAADIYTQAQIWIADNYVNPEAVTVANIDNKILKGRGVEVRGAHFGVVPVYFDLKYSFSIDVKEGKARLTMSDFFVESPTQKHSAETYCIKGNGDRRSNIQSKAFFIGYESICVNHFATFNAMFEKAEKDDW